MSNGPMSQSPGCYVALMAGAALIAIGLSQGWVNVMAFTAAKGYVLAAIMGLIGIAGFATAMDRK